MPFSGLARWSLRLLRRAFNAFRMFSTHLCTGPLPCVAGPAVANAVAVGVTALTMLPGPVLVLELVAVLAVAGWLEVLGIGVVLNVHRNRKAY